MASEEPEEEPFAPCRKVVGKDLAAYLLEETPVKVVFLYTVDEACEVCGEMLRVFADLAEKMYDPEVVSFAYYDIFRNDNPLIADEILPYFLIFTGDQTEPYGLEGEKMNELYQTIIDIVMKDTEINLPNDHKREVSEPNFEGSKAPTNTERGDGSSHDL